MNKQWKEFSCKWNPWLLQRHPFRRGEPAVQRERSHQTCVLAFECTLPRHWAEKPWEQAFMEITGCNWQGTPGFVDRDGWEAWENGFGHESLNGRCSLGLFLFGLQELISTTFSSTGFFLGGGGQWWEMCNFTRTSAPLERTTLLSDFLRVMENKGEMSSWEHGMIFHQGDSQWHGVANVTLNREISGQS